MTKPAKVSSSYLELCFHIDKEQNVYLRVPTVWDDIEKKWIGFCKTPKSQTLIHASGKNSFELQNNFTRVVKEFLQKGDSVSDEVFSMFQPLSYWDEMGE